MLSTLTTVWIILSGKGGLPTELILKILFQFNGLQHPLVKLLLNKTKRDDYEQLIKLPFSKTIQRHYYKYGCNNELITLIINKQKNYFMYNCSSYTTYENPGYFIPRQLGRLYYTVLNDNMKVDYNNYHTDFKLNRSKKIIEKIKCITCRKLYIHDSGAYNFDDYSNDFGPYTELLMRLEKNNLVNKYLCLYCRDVVDDYSLSIVQ